MATSAFRSTTRRAPVGAPSSTDDSSSSNRSAGGGVHRRSRSLSRFSRRLLAPEFSDEAPPTKGRFVNTMRGSGFPEISLDDLAIELFSDEIDSDRGRSSRRSSNTGPSTAAGVSQRRGRSVSRQNSKAGDGRSNACNDSSGRGRSVGIKSVSDQNSRRRSISVTRHQIAEPESDADHSQKFRNHASQNNFRNRKTEMQSLENIVPTHNRRGLGRSLSHKDLSKLQEGYSSQSSALTDDEARDTYSGRNGIEKTIRALPSHNKSQHPTGEDINSGLYETVKMELRHAVEEIKNELGQAKVNDSSLPRNGYIQSNNSDVLKAASTIKRNYVLKLEESEKRKHDLLAEILLEEERGKELSKIVKELLPGPKVVVKKPSRTRKRSNDRNRMSNRLTEEAEKYLEDFISNIEDTDISSFDGERSDGSSALGGFTKSMNLSSHFGDIETQTPGASTTVSVEMDELVLPWLQWETSNDSAPTSHKSNAHSPMTPKAIFRDTKERAISHDRSNHSDSTSSRGSWSPGVANSHSREPMTSRSSGVGRRMFYDSDDYLNLQNSEDLLFETLKQQQRIRSGGLLLCNKLFI